MPYRAATTLLKPVIDRYLRQRLRRGKEDPARFQERLGIASQPRPSGKLIWCHAASVGEAVSVLRLLQELRKQFPSLNILLTSGTVASARLLATRLPEGVIHHYVPVDVPDYAARFVAHWQPDLALWLESELWPNLLQELRTRGTPAILLNGRMSERSYRRWRWLRPWIKQLLSSFALTLAQTGQAAEYFRNLGAKDVRLIGNLKYTAEPLRSDAAELARLKAATTDRTIWLMAATHPGEDEIALATHQRLSKRHPHLLTIIVPRHVSRADTIANLLAEHNIPYSRRAQGQPITPGTQIYLADTMGELGLFYSLTQVTCIGGSFTWGGHNPIEAAQLGCPMIFGPRMTNFPDIAAEFLAGGAARSVTDVEALAVAVDELLSSAEDRIQLADNAQRLLAGKRLILPDTIAALRPWLDRLTEAA
jgi:3-deoxy-D-manno-octulosonic-acid transferase